MILRHAKSSWSDPDLADYDRPLKGRGKRACSKMGDFLAARDLVPEMVISSSALRAAETARRVCRRMGFAADAIQLRVQLYHAGVETLRASVAACPAHLERVMLVGHNPGLEMFTIWLADQAPPLPEDGKLIPTATLVRMALTTSWTEVAQGSGRLLEIVRPRSL